MSSDVEIIFGQTSISNVSHENNIALKFLTPYTLAGFEPTISWAIGGNESNFSRLSSDFLSSGTTASDSRKKRRKRLSTVKSDDADYKNGDVVDSLPSTVFSVQRGET
jgi:hypothetical protein